MNDHHQQTFFLHTHITQTMSPRIIDGKSDPFILFLLTLVPKIDWKCLMEFPFFLINSASGSWMPWKQNHKIVSTHTHARTHAHAHTTYLSMSPKVNRGCAFTPVCLCVYLWARHLKKMDRFEQYFRNWGKNLFTTEHNVIVSSLVNNGDVRFHSVVDILDWDGQPFSMYHFTCTWASSVLIASTNMSWEIQASCSKISDTVNIIIHVSTVVNNIVR